MSIVFGNPKKSTQSSKSKAKKNSPNKLSQFVKDERVHRIIGLLFIITSVFLCFSFISYLFTWKEDYSIIEDCDWLTWLNANPDAAQNQLGLLGAYISHRFLNNWFGISSFVFVLWSFLIGWKILFNKQLLSFKNIFYNSFFILIWFSASLAFIFDSSLYYLGGGLGHFLSNKLTGLSGSLGTILVLLFAALSYSIWVFKLNFNFNFKKTESDQELESQSEEGENYTDFSSLSEEAGIIKEELELESTKEQSSDTAELEKEEPASPEVVEDDGFEVLDTSEPLTAKSKETKAEEVQLAVEETKEEKEATSKDVAPTSKDYDPKLDLGSYEFPKIDLLEDFGDTRTEVTQDELESNKNRIIETLANYNIGIAKIKATIGPTVTLYEIVPEAGIRISKIKNLEDDIALSLSALGIRIIAPMPGKGTIGIEVPNKKPEIVSMRSVLGIEKFQNTDFDLPIALGKTISNEVYIADLAKMPHLLIAGATGQGKSVGLNAILCSLLYKKHPAELKFVLIDPKKVELTLYKRLEKHFLAKLPNDDDPIITDTKKIILALNSLCVEMDLRYDLLKAAQARNIKEYNKKFIDRKLNPENGHRFLPLIVLVIDEFADLIMTAGKEVEMPIARLAQLARAIGIHLVIATQRPSVNIITGTIKANFPARLAFKVTAKIDSRTILDTGGADQLIGRGDMLFSPGGDIVRLQCAFLDTPEVEKITAFIGDQRGYPEAYVLPEYQDESAEPKEALSAEDRDLLFEDAARVVVQQQQGSTSLIQRRMKLGYNRAGRIMDQLEAAGIVGPPDGSKPRTVLIMDEYSLERILNEGIENDEQSGNI
ncbi:DNA translocase FtsK [bacterium AH-315-C07]|nr:DNA translocase FtsK [bacterium AH-315-C07]